MASFYDGLKNLIANLGTARDKAAGNTYAQSSLSYDEARNAYRTSWLAKKIVNIPAHDAFREWREWNADAATISLLEAEESRLRMPASFVRAKVAARLYGGSAIYIGTADKDLSEPLDVERIGKGGVRYLTVLTPLSVSGGDTDYDPASEFYLRPRYWNMQFGTGGSLQIHPSRFVFFIGSELPPDDPVSMMGWGDSSLMALIEAVKMSDATMANVASLVFEAKIDVIRVPDMMERLSDPIFAAQLENRFSLAALGKGNNGTLILDKDEEYEQKNYAFAGLPPIMDQFFQAVSGAADIPMTRLLGQSPGGLNSTGDGDLRNYYDSIGAMQTLEITPAMYRLDEALIRSALGNRPPEIFMSWRPLWRKSEKEIAEIGKITADTVVALHNTGLYLPEVLAKVGANSLVEDGVFPGMEAAMLEAGPVIEPDGDDETGFDEPPEEVI